MNIYKMTEEELKELTCFRNFPEKCIGSECAAFRYDPGMWKDHEGVDKTCKTDDKCIPSGCYCGDIGQPAQNKYHDFASEIDEDDPGQPLPPHGSGP